MTGDPQQEQPEKIDLSDLDTSVVDPPLPFDPDADQPTAEDLQALFDENRDDILHEQLKDPDPTKPIEDSVDPAKEGQA